MDVNWLPTFTTRNVQATRLYPDSRTGPQCDLRHGYVAREEDGSGWQRAAGSSGVGGKEKDTAGVVIFGGQERTRSA